MDIAGIGENGPAAECSRPVLHPALEPSDDRAAGDAFRDDLREVLVGAGDVAIADAEMTKALGYARGRVPPAAQSRRKDAIDGGFHVGDR